MGDPEDPITELAAAAAQLHELYTAYIDAGFTEPQAFDLIKTVMLGSVGG